MEEEQLRLSTAEGVGGEVIEVEGEENRDGEGMEEGERSLVAVLVLVPGVVPETVRGVEGEGEVEGVTGRVRVGAPLAL